MTREEIEKLPRKIEIPTLREAEDGNKSCGTCQWFSCTGLSCQGGWCAKHMCQAVNTDVYSVCDEWEILLYKLNDAQEVVRVKPCRRCYEKSKAIQRPKFYWYSDDINYINMYRVYCPICDKDKLSGMDESELNLSRLEARWNDWDKPFSEWEADLNW